MTADSRTVSIISGCSGSSQQTQRSQSLPTVPTATVTGVRTGTVEFSDEACGTTWGHFIADPATYGTEKEWVVLKGIPIELSDDEDMDEHED